MADADDRGPAISVVVATRNRSHLLSRLVEALAEQQGAPPFELIVVDDASTDATEEVLDRLARATSIPIRHISLDQRGGPAIARNAGWRLSSAPLIAFTDDDCVPQPGWLAVIGAGLRNADIARGATMANPTQQADGWFSWAPETSEEVGFFETCNIGYRRSALVQVDGFAECWRLADGSRSFATPHYRAPVWGEDTDLALRVTRAGGTSVFVPGAVVWHDLKPGRFRDRLADIPRRGGVVLATKRHPELRARFESPWFMQMVHAWYLGALLGVAVVVSRPRSPCRWLLAASLAWPWARRRGAHYPRRAWPRVLPQWFVIDGFEIAVMATASARHGTVLL